MKVTSHYLSIKRLTQSAVVSGGLFVLSGCFITSPFWNQVFSSHTAQVPLQAWTTNNSTPVVFECSQAFHGGLYPYYGPTWTQVASVMPSSDESLDPNGVPIYSASWEGVLSSSSCWRQDPGNGIYYAAIRAVQGSNEFSGFDNVGLECLGREVGKDASWYGWLTEGCTKTYSNSNNDIPYVIFRTGS